MRAGRLPHRVKIQRKRVPVQPAATATQNAFGELPTTQGATGEETTRWQDVATVWAFVQPLQGREYMQAKQTQEELTTRITMRYRADLSANDRLLHGADVYDVLSVLQTDNSQRQTVAMCRWQRTNTP